MSVNPIETRALSCAIGVDMRAMTDRAEGDSRVPVAISSELPVMRAEAGTAYLEVLDHSPDAVNMAATLLCEFFLSGWNWCGQGEGGSYLTSVCRLQAGRQAGRQVKARQG